MIQLTGCQYSYRDGEIIRGNIEFITDDTEILSKLYNSLSIIDLFIDKDIIKCKHCGQWGARKTECVKCGAPID